MEKTFMPEGYILDNPENIEHTHTLSGLEYAHSASLILEGRATLCDANQNLIVEMGKFRGVIPKEECAFCPGGEAVKDIAVITRVGKPVCFKVKKIDKTDGDIKIILSRKDAQKECYENYISYLVPGDIIDAKVTHMEPFGAFCDIGCGIVSLLSVDCISVSRISHPKERFRCGQYIKCAVKSIDRENSRIVLSHKELLGTWEQNAKNFAQGQTAAGIIRSVEPYGVFVELTPNLAGLAEWCDDICIGQGAAVYIKSIIPEKMKVKLVIVDKTGTTPQIKPPEYYIDDTHISFWQYSPEGCDKNIYTDFDGCDS